MAFLNAVVDQKLRLLLVAAALSFGPSSFVAHAQMAPANVPVVGCQGSAIPLDTDAETNDDGADEADSADETNDTNDSDHGPAIVGTIKAPPGMKESDKRLTSLAKITPAQAQTAALAAIGDASKRRVSSVGVEMEQGYVVYAVKTQLNGAGVDPKLEVKVDAGSGAVLLIECDPGDN